MESNIWRTRGEKNLIFFQKNHQDPYFDVQKNGFRSSNRLEVKKIVKDPSRESTEVTPMKILLCIAISSIIWVISYLYWCVSVLLGIENEYMIFNKNGAVFLTRVTRGVR